MRTLLIALCALLPLGYGSEYFGVKLGKFRNKNLDISGVVYLANKTHIQIAKTNIPALKDQTPQFVFSSNEVSQPAVNVYQILPSPGGPYTTRLNSSLSQGLEKARILVEIPKLANSKWNSFGIAVDQSFHYIASVELNKSPPKPFCCLSNDANGNKGIMPLEYEASSDPLVVLDTKTLVLPNFKFKGSSPPDGWIYVGKGSKINQNTGEKAFILGRDSPSKHCAIHEDYSGNTNLTVRLGEGQNIFNTDYLSVFCYQYSVDFGHIKYHISPEMNPLPAFIPPLSDGPLKKVHKNKKCST